MGTETLVDDQVEVGRKVVNLLGERGFDVTAAGWAKTLDDGRWFLYVASNQVEEKGLIAAYRELNDVLRNVSNDWISLDDVKLIGKNNPATRDLVELSRRYSGPVPAIALRRIGSLFVEDVHVYPPPTALRLAFSVTYRRQGESNVWYVTTERGKPYPNLPFDGVASHSSPFDGYETISVLLKIDPRFGDERSLRSDAARIYLADQARAIADESFKTRHPDADVRDEPDPIVDPNGEGE